MNDLNVPSDHQKRDVTPPNDAEAKALLRFIQIFGRDGYDPYSRKRNYYSYKKDVIEFFNLLSKQQWMSQFYNYDPACGGLAEDGDLEQIGYALTWCLRAEHWGEGGWATVIEDGKLLKLLWQVENILNGEC